MKHFLLPTLLLVLLAGCRSVEKRSGPPPPPPPPIGMQGGLQQAQQPTVLVQGDVKNHVIPLSEDMTVAQAIDAAEYKSYFDPHQILLIRHGQATRIEPRKLLSGRQNPVLEAGDIIQLQ
jgi:hypothetical protein